MFSQNMDVALDGAICLRTVALVAYESNRMVGVSPLSRQLVLVSVPPPGNVNNIVCGTKCDSNHSSRVLHRWRMMLTMNVPRCDSGESDRLARTKSPLPNKGRRCRTKAAVAERITVSMCTTATRPRQAMTGETTRSRRVARRAMASTATTTALHQEHTLREMMAAAMIARQTRPQGMPDTHPLLATTCHEQVRSPRGLRRRGQESGGSRVRTKRVRRENGHA